MGDLLKLLAFGATAAAAVVVAKEVIERSERGEDCSPLAVVKGIGRKIGDLCGNGDKEEDFDDFDDFEAFSALDDDDEDLTFDIADMEGDQLNDDELVQLEIEIEAAPEAEEKAETENETEVKEEEADTEAAVEEALKNAAEIDEDEDEE